MAKINNEILPGNFEVIRDQIGLILKEELSNQAAITNNDLFDCGVWTERFIPFQIGELPAVMVRFGSNTHTNRSQKGQDVDSTYLIDVHTIAEEDGAAMGDANSIIKNQKLCSVINQILNDTNYVTLSMVPGTIKSKEVQQINMADISSMQGTDNVMFGRLTLKINSWENFGLVQENRILTSENTTVKIEETEKGHKFEKIWQ